MSVDWPLGFYWMEQRNEEDIGCHDHRRVSVLYSISCTEVMTHSDWRQIYWRYLSLYWNLKKFNDAIFIFTKLIRNYLSKVKEWFYKIWHPSLQYNFNMFKNNSFLINCKEAIGPMNCYQPLNEEINKFYTVHLSLLGFSFKIRIDFWRFNISRPKNSPVCQYYIKWCSLFIQHYFSEWSLSLIFFSDLLPVLKVLI